MSSLFPKGFKHLGDLPYPLHDAITMALQFLSFEELPKDERPSRSIYLNMPKLKEHFEAVEKRREEKYGGKDKGIEDPVENQAAKSLMTSE